MHEIYFVSVFLHILAATIWIGGMVFIGVVLIPAIKKHPDKAALIHSTGIKFRSVGWVVIVLLFVTGLYNMHVRHIDFSISGLSDTRAGRMLLYKLIIFSTIVILSSIHDFYIGTKATELWMKDANSDSAKNIRAWARWAGRINLILSLIALGIGVALVRGF